MAQPDEDSGATPEAGFALRQAPIQPFSKNSIPSGVGLKRTPQHDTSEVGDSGSELRRSAAWTVSLVEDLEPKEENLKPANVIPTGTQLLRTPFVKDATPTKSLGLPDASFEEFTPPDERRPPIWRAAVGHLSLNGKNGPVVSVTSLVQATPISGQTGVAKSGVELPVIRSIDDIVVAAAARVEPPEVKVISPVNVIPTGKQLARTPFTKGCANSGDCSLQDSFQRDLSAGPGSRRSTRGATSLSAASAPTTSSASTSAVSSSVKSVAKENKVLPARPAARKLGTIVEGLDETVREAVDPIVSCACLVSQASYR